MKPSMDIITTATTIATRDRIIQNYQLQAEKTYSTTMHRTMTRHITTHRTTTRHTMTRHIMTSTPVNL